MKPEVSKQELSHERDRLRLLLEVNNAVTSKLDLQELLLAVGTSLRKVIPHDLTGLAIYDGKNLEMKVDALDSSFGPEQVFPTGQFMPLEGNPVGLALTTRKPVIRYRIDHQTYPAPKFQEFCDVMGLKSGVSVPLLLQDRAVGCISVSSIREAAFDEADAELLQEIAGQLAIAVENAVNFRAAKRESDRKQLLLEINNAVASNLDLHALLQVISTALRDLVPHDYTGLAIYDERIGELRIHRVEAETPGILPEGESIPMEGTTAGLAFTTRQIVRRDRLDLTEFDAPVFRTMVEALNIKSACVLPLIVHDRPIGVVSLTSCTEGAFSEDDAELLGHVSEQLAIAVENAVNFQRAQWERNRRQLLLEVNNAVVSNLSLHDLLISVSGWLRKFIKHDFASVVLLDKESGQLRIHALDKPIPGGFAREGGTLPIDGTPAGLAIKTGATVRRDNLDFEEFYHPMVRLGYAVGLRSGMSVCLISHDKILGSINVGSMREASFTQEDQELLEEIAGQVAIAAENALNFEQAQRERARAETLLQINNAVSTHLDLRDLLFATSQCLQQYFKNDTTGMALYDAETNKLRVHAMDIAALTGSYVMEGYLMGLDETPGGRCYTTRKPILIHKLRAEDWPSPAVERAVALGIQSTCNAPLIAHDKALGSVVIASKREAAFTEADAEMLTHIGKQLSLAVENALNFEAARKEKARAETLLEINNAITTHLDLHELLVATAKCLTKFFNHDATGLALYDPIAGKLKVHSMNDSGEPSNLVPEGLLTALDETPGGRAFATRKTLIVDKLRTDEWPSPAIEKIVASGIQSTCSAPLIAHDQALGAVIIASRTEAAFSKADAEMLTNIAQQLAIAVENSLNFEASQKEKARAETLLEINNAITTQIELPQLVRAISESLRNYFKHDVTGMTLYDAKNNEWRLHALEAVAGGDEYLEAGIPTSLDSPAGKAITTRTAVVIDKLDYAEYPSELMKRAIEAGFQSSCNVPLIAHDRVLGAVVLVSRKEAAFTKDDAEMLGHIAKQLAIAVENALNYREVEVLKNKLVSEKLYLEEEIQTQYNFEEIIGQSAALKKILQQVATVAPTDSVVLLCGETGTGKELIARAIHNLSGRKERTLVKLNCAAIPTGLLESELFGHEKGAFTGAIAQRIGRFELANKGSLLLDEIGEIPLDLQPKLLRVLQEHEFERLGSSRTIKTDARLIAATNVNLPDMVAEKKFRSDLFYRLNVFPITIPPLRERAGDIPLLVGYFVQKHSLRMNKRIDIIPKSTVDALCEYSWPGNVRELENFIERSVILSSGSELQAPLSELRTNQNAVEGDGAGPIAASSGPVSLEENERRHILEVLDRTKGVIGGKGGAAEILGLPISTLRNRMKKLGLK
jgi:formate hydrogenlyase transcriptional activator